MLPWLISMFQQEDCKLEDCDRSQRPAGTKMKDRTLWWKGVEYYHIPMTMKTISDSPESALGILQTNDMLKKVLEYDGDIESLIEQQYENFVKHSVFRNNAPDLWMYCCITKMVLLSYTAAWQMVSGGSDSPSLCSWSSQRCDPGGFYTFQCVPGRRTDLYAALP